MNAKLEPEEGEALAVSRPHEGAPLRIHEVAELTGVPGPTIRAWERRYGVPVPQRTPGGYRIYAAREIAQVREMRNLCERGVAASEAARSILERFGAAPAVSRESIESYDEAVHALLAAVVRFDAAALDRIADRVLYLGSPTDVLDHVVEPVLVEIGARWHREVLSVAQEHFGSQRLGALLRDLLRISSTNVGKRRILLACFADDPHELGALAVAVRVATWGYHPIFLGARTPPSAIESALTLSKPFLLGLSITDPVRESVAQELVADYAKAASGTPWMVGGSAVSSVASFVQTNGGIVAPRDSGELRALIDSLAQARKDESRRKT